MKTDTFLSSSTRDRIQAPGALADGPGTPDGAPPHLADFARDVLHGLSQPQKKLPCTWLYDHRGSALFEDITRLPEYYPTRTEARLLRELAPELAGMLGAGLALVELGSGSSVKTRLLLQALPELACYVPVDISAEFLHQAVAQLAQEFPGLPLRPVVADFSRPFDLPALGRQSPGAAGANADQAQAHTQTQTHAHTQPLVPAHRRLGFFPGSTIGNFSPDAAVALLARFAGALGPGSHLLIGVDTTQDPALLLPAYDDAQGVTAEFNLNLLARINRELLGRFDLRQFHHAARFDAGLGRIEMHLVSECAQQAKVLGHGFRFKAGESIHTENAYKYTAGAFERLAAQAGWRRVRAWVDASGNGFTVFLMRCGE